jgi:hypothetical protein
MAKVTNKANKKQAFGTRKTGVHKKKRNKHESVKAYKGQGK